MPRPRNHDDQPRCDECNDYGEWSEINQQYLCEHCWSPENIWPPESEDDDDTE